MHALQGNVPFARVEKSLGSKYKCTLAKALRMEIEPQKVFAGERADRPSDV